MTAQGALTFAGLFLIVWTAMALLMICGWCLAERMGDDGYSPEHYGYERAEAADAQDADPYYDDRPTRAEAERDEREDEARGRP